MSDAESAVSRPAKRILWVDDEIDLLTPHLLFLQQRGYHVDAIPNGDDALELLRRNRYDLVLLDEQMPGRRGLDLLQELRREEPNQRVVMVTKSEEDTTLQEAVGRQVEAYLVKPTSPRQVLSVVTRLLEGPSLHQERVARDFARRFGELSARRDRARTPDDFAQVYSELVDWHLRLGSAEEEGLTDTVDQLLTDLRKDFSEWIPEVYPGWVRGDAAERPVLSVDVVREFVVPRLSGKPVVFVILDCMRLDQWRLVAPFLSDHFDIEETLYYSILPTATPYSRNAIFGGRYPRGIAADHPGWWDFSDDEGSLNAFEDDLLREQLRRLTGRDVPVHYEKVFTDQDAEELLARVKGAFRVERSVVALVFNFVDLLVHGRSESSVLKEVARDEPALRNLTRSWFERSAALRILKEAARQELPVVLTTDHGSILCQRPATIHARRDATDNLRYKFGQDLRVEDEAAAYVTTDADDLGFPEGKLGTTYAIADEDRFFVYPTKLREYQARYRDSFLHGGISPEEMILPVATLAPRRTEVG